MPEDNDYEYNPFEDDYPTTLFSSEWQDLQNELATLKEVSKKAEEENQVLKRNLSQAQNELVGYQRQDQCSHTKQRNWLARELNKLADCKIFSAIVGQRCSEGAVFVCQICGKSWYIEPALIHSSFEMGEFRDMWREFFAAEFEVKDRRIRELEDQIYLLSEGDPIEDKVISDAETKLSNIHQLVYHASFFFAHGLKKAIKEILG